MADLALRTSLTTVEQALWLQLLLAYGKRLPVAATVAALRTAYTSPGRSPSDLVYVTAAAYAYRWSRYSTAADDGDAVIKPSDNPTAGRWLKTTSTVTSGYAQTVRVHPDEDAYENFLIRGRGQRPSLHVVWLGETKVSRSLTVGALYVSRSRYAIRALSQSLRDNAEAAVGSEIAAEAAVDPGAHTLIGDLEDNLAGSTLSTTGVHRIELGPMTRTTTALGGRSLVESVEITVFSTVHRPDTDGVTLDDPRTLDVTRKLAAGEYDTDNVVTSGYTVAVGAGLTKTPATGTGVVGGTAVSSSPASKTFTASRDTYRDLTTAGAFVYQEVLNGAQAPDVTAGAMRVGVTVTDASAVVWDQMLCATFVTFGATDRVPAT